MPAIQREVDGIQAGSFKFKSLNIDNEIPGDKRRVAGNDDIQRYVNRRHDGFPIFVDEIDFHLVFAFFHFVEDHAQGNRALRMDSWKLAGKNRVERAEDIQLTAIIGGGVAKNCCLDIHLVTGLFLQI